jgi:hypothetical protein
VLHELLSIPLAQLWATVSLEKKQRPQGQQLFSWIEAQPELWRELPRARDWQLCRARGHHHPNLKMLSRHMELVAVPVLVEDGKRKTHSEREAVS